MARDDRRTLEKRAQVGRRVALPRMRAQRLDVRREHPVRAEQGLDADRRRDVGEPQQQPQVVARQDEHPEHAVGPVEQREPFLLRELDGLQTVRCQRFRRGDQ